MRHVPASVAQLGEMVGAKKREASLFQRDKKSRTHARYLARCMRDATITYRAAKHFHASYKELGQRPRMTLASTALAIWRDKYWGREVRRPMQYVWEAALEAYHGGRTQAFAVGTFPKVQVADVSSMYPWAMVNAPLPLPWGMVRFVGRDADVRAAALYDVTVDSALSIPRLPVRTSEGTAFPNGRWRGWYVGEELLAFVRAGGRLRVNRGIEFLEQCEPFKGYVASMFRRKQASRGMSRTVYKLLLNSLYGKFGQQGRQVRCMELSEFMALEHAPHDWRYWNGLAIFSEDGPPPPWGNNVWAAFVTARARDRLASELERVTKLGGRVLYCDTDSIMYQGERPTYPEKAARPGEFESRGRYRSLLIVGKKEYALESRKDIWHPQCKGVPEAERMLYLTTGSVTFQRPTRLRESARLGVTANVWREVPKVRKTDLRKKVSRTDGTLPVLWIGPESVKGKTDGKARITQG